MKSFDATSIRMGLVTTTVATAAISDLDPSPTHDAGIDTVIDDLLMVIGDAPLPVGATPHTTAPPPTPRRAAKKRNKPPRELTPTVMVKGRECRRCQYIVTHGQHKGQQCTHHCRAYEGQFCGNHKWRGMSPPKGR